METISTTSSTTPTPYANTPTGAAPMTTAQREWLGWFGCAAWLVFVNFGYQSFVRAESVYDADNWYQFGFLLILAVSIAVLGFLYGRDPDRLSRIAFFTTPAAIILTAVFVFIPEPFGLALFGLTYILMAPAITRNVYGALRTAGKKYMTTRYALAYALSVAAVTAWVMLGPPKEIAFAVPALLAILAWLGVRRSVTLPDKPPETGAFKVSKSLVLVLVLAVAFLFWLDIMHIMIHMLVGSTGSDGSLALVFSLLSYILPPAGILLYAVIGDKGHERTGFTCGIGLFLISILLAILPESGQGVNLILAFAEGLAGAYTQFFLLTIPIFFFANSKRPVFAASLGMIFTLLISAMYQKIFGWMPKIFWELNVYVLVSAAISAVVFIILIVNIFERRHEKTLAAALYAMLHNARTSAESEVTAGESPFTAPPQKTDTEVMVSAGFTEDEIKVATLLIEGGTKHDISRKLNLHAEVTSQRMASIREKITGIDDPGLAFTAVIKKYRLTGREADVLRGIRNDMTNAQIAEILGVTEKTVTNYATALYKKLSVDSRKAAIERLDLAEKDS